MRQTDETPAAQRRIRLHDREVQMSNPDSGARDDVVAAAKRLSACAAEFDGDLSICGKYIEALDAAVARLTAEEALQHG
jgi:hypothetical protein